MHAVRLQVGKDHEGEEKKHPLAMIIFNVYLSITIKYVVPIAISFISIRALKADIDTNYGGYPTWAQWVGWIIVILGALMGIIPAFFCTT